MLFCAAPSGLPENADRLTVRSSRRWKIAQALIGSPEGATQNSLGLGPRSRSWATIGRGRREEKKLRFSRWGRFSS